MASPQGHTSMASSGHPSLPFASPLAANRHPRAHPRATHQWLLMGVQVCTFATFAPTSSISLLIPLQTILFRTSTLHTPHSTLYTLHVALYTLHSTLHTLQVTLYTPRCSLHTLHSTLHSLHSTLYTLHYTLHALHFTLPLAAASTKPCCKLLLFQRCSLPLACIALCPCSLPFASFQKMLPPKRWQRRVAWPTVTVGTSGGFYIMAYKLTLYLIWDLMDLAPTIFLLPYFSLNILEPPKGWMRWSMWEDCCNGL